MSVVCLINDTNNKDYNINGNLLTVNNNEFTFNKIFKNIDINDVYQNEIIDKVTDNSLRSDSIKQFETFILLGKHSFYNIFDQITDEFNKQTCVYNFYIHEILSSGIRDYMTSKYFLLNDEIKNNFANHSFYIDPTMINHKKKLSEIKKILLNKQRKYLSHLILTVENFYQSVTIYFLHDLCKTIEDNRNTGFFMYKDYFDLKQLLEKSSDPTYNDNSELIDLISLDLETNVSTILNLTNPNHIKTCKLATLFKNNKEITQLVPFTKIQRSIILDSTFATQYNSSALVKKFIKPEHNYKVLNPPDKNNIENANNSLVKYEKPLNKKIIKNTKEVPNSISYELIKYKIIEDPELIHQSLIVYNKFLFDSCVKNQLNLKKGHQNTALIKQTNNDVLINMKSILTVILEKLNEL